MTFKFWDCIAILIARGLAQKKDQKIYSQTLKKVPRMANSYFLCLFYFGLYSTTEGSILL